MTFPNICSCIREHVFVRLHHDCQKKNFFVESFQHSVKNGAIKNIEKHEEPAESFEKPSAITAFFTLLGLYTLLFLGAISQLLFPPNVAKEKNRDGYVPLYNKFESFYSNYVYRRMKDCFNKPIISVPGSTFWIKDRITKDFGWSFKYTGTKTNYMNLGSYNYLGFAQNEGPCADQSQESLEEFGVALCSSRRELGENFLFKVDIKF